MAEYKDIDEILKTLPDDLPYKASVKRVLIQAPTADVVPRSEVERIFDEVDSMLDLVGAMVGLDIRVYGKYAELKKKYTERVCTDCKHFVGCECFSGQTCDEYTEGGAE